MVMAYTIPKLLVANKREAYITTHYLRYVTTCNSTDKDSREKNPQNFGPHNPKINTTSTRRATKLP